MTPRRRGRASNSSDDSSDGDSEPNSDIEQQLDGLKGALGSRYVSKCLWIIDFASVIACGRVRVLSFALVLLP